MFKFFTTIVLFFQALLGIQQVQMPSQPVVHHIKIEKPKAFPALGGTVDITATIIPTSNIVASIGTTTQDTLSVTPSVSYTGNTVSFSASGIYDDCLYEVNGDTRHIKQADIFVVIVPSGKSYPYSLWCATQGHQPKGIIGNIVLP